MQRVSSGRYDSSMDELIYNKSRASIVYTDGTVNISRRSRQSSAKNCAENGYSEKTYGINARVKRAIRSKVAAMWHNARTNGNSCVFYTLTSAESNKIESNLVVSKYLENVRRNQGVVAYVFVRERQKSGNNHWHIIAEVIPKDGKKKRPLDYKAHRNAWNSALKNAGYKPSGNSVRFGNKPVLMSYHGAVAYVTKYCTKNIKENKKEAFRVTHSSRIRYKGQVFVEMAIRCNETILSYRISEWAVTYKYDANLKYYEWALKSFDDTSDIIKNYIKHGKIG